MSPNDILDIIQFLGNFKIFKIHFILSCQLDIIVIERSKAFFKWLTNKQFSVLMIDLLFH